MLAQRQTLAMAKSDQGGVCSPHLRHRLVLIVCCLVEWSNLDRDVYGKRRETRVMLSFQFFVRRDFALVRGGVLLLVHVVALLRGVVALLCGVVVLLEAVFAVSQVLMASSKRI